MRSEPSRTFIGSVACVDLVGYSRRSVAQQMQVKQAFNRLLAQVLSRIPPDDRIVLDTGDGAAIAFLADPQTCMEACLELRDAMNAARAELGSPTVGPMRIGVNLGPMRLTLDVNGRPNIVGDGVVSAERIMPLAQPGEIVASRSFHEMVSHISDDLARRFDASRQGQDRTGQAREVFPVRSANAPEPVRTREGDPDAREMTQLQRPAARAAAAPAAAVHATPAPLEPPPAAATADASASGLVAFLRDGRKVGIASAALLAVILAEGGWLAMRNRAPAATSVATAPTPAPVPAPLPKPDAPKAPIAAAPPPIAAPGIDKPAPAAKPEPASAKSENAKPDHAKPEPAKEPVRDPAKPPASKTPEATRPVPDKVPPAPLEAKKAPERSPAPAPAEAAKKSAPKDTPAGRDANARRDGTRPEDTRPAAQAPAPTPAPAPAPTPAPAEVKPAPPPAPSTAVVLLQRTPVTFPIAVAAKGISEGQIRARLTISAAGTVTDVRVTASEPPRVFDRDAVRTLQGWRFNAGTEGRTYDVELDFKR